MTLPIKRLKESDNTTEFQPFIDADQRTARMDLAHASASNPKVADLLNVTLTDDPTADNNLISSFGNDDPSVTITNAPVGGSFYGTRIVTKSTSARASLCNVTLIESYPLPGRIWMNIFNPDVSTWVGWREIPTTSQNIHIDSGQLGYAEIGNDGEGGFVNLSNDNGYIHIDCLNNNLRIIKFNSSGGIDEAIIPSNHVSYPGSSEVGLSWGIDNTIPADGWITCGGDYGNYSEIHIYVNNYPVAYMSTSSEKCISFYSIPVRKNDIVKATGGRGSQELTFNYNR